MQYWIKKTTVTEIFEPVVKDSISVVWWVSAGGSLLLEGGGAVQLLLLLGVERNSCGAATAAGDPQQEKRQMRRKNWLLHCPKAKILVQRPCFGPVLLSPLSLQTFAVADALEGETAANWRRQQGQGR